MYSPAEVRPERNVIIYSADFIIGRAMECLFRKRRRQGKKDNVCIVRDIDALFSYIVSDSVDCVVLNIAARDHTRLLCAIRRHAPVLPVIIVQPRHLFSDRAAASWFGNIWLQDYESMLAGYPEISPDACVSDERFSGAGCTAACSSLCSRHPVSGAFFGSLQRWLAHQLQVRMSSRRCAAVALEGLATGLLPREVSKLMGGSDKVIYHYRWRVMRELGLRNRTFDFIPSLTLREGPEPAGSQTECHMKKGRRHDGQRKETCDGAAEKH